MCQHGWGRVRGGRWCQLALEGPPDAVRRAIPPRKSLDQSRAAGLPRQT